MATVINTTPQPAPGGRVPIFGAPQAAAPEQLYNPARSVGGVALPPGKLLKSHIGDPNNGAFFSWDSVMAERGVALVSSHEDGTPAVWRGQPTGDGTIAGRPLTKSTLHGMQGGPRPYVDGVTGETPYEGSGAGEAHPHYGYRGGPMDAGASFPQGPAPGSPPSGKMSRGVPFAGELAAAGFMPAGASEGGQWIDWSAHMGGSRTPAKPAPTHFAAPPPPPATTPQHQGSTSMSSAMMSGKMEVDIGETMAVLHALMTGQPVPRAKMSTSSSGRGQPSEFVYGRDDQGSKEDAKGNDDDGQDDEKEPTEKSLGQLLGELEELAKAGTHKYKSRKKVGDRWVYDYGEKKGGQQGGLFGPDVMDRPKKRPQRGTPSKGKDPHEKFAPPKKRGVPEGYERNDAGYLRKKPPTPPPRGEALRGEARRRTDEAAAAGLDSGPQSKVRDVLIGQGHADGFPDSSATYPTKTGPLAKLGLDTINDALKHYTKESVDPKHPKELRDKLDRVAQHLHSLAVDLRVDKNRADAKAHGELAKLAESKAYPTPRELGKGKSYEQQREDRNKIRKLAEEHIMKHHHGSLKDKDHMIAAVRALTSGLKGGAHLHRGYDNELGWSSGEKKDRDDFEDMLAEMAEHDTHPIVQKVGKSWKIHSVLLHETGAHELKDKKPWKGWRKSMDPITETDMAGRPLRKGLHVFADSRSTGALPESYLYDYLCAFVEEAYEHESKEGAHRNPNAHDQLDAMSTAIMHELVQYLPLNENLRRACEATGCNKTTVARILVEKGIMQPASDIRFHGDNEGAAAMGANLEEMAYSHRVPWLQGEPAPRNGQALVNHDPEDAAHLVKSDAVNPFLVLQQRRAAEVRQLWQSPDQPAEAHIAHDCPVHGGRDLTKSMNLWNPMQPCICKGKPDAYG